MRVAASGGRGRRGRGREKYSCVHEHARETDEELNEPTRGPNLANFLKTHLRPVFLLSERPPLKRWRLCCVIEAGFHDQSRWPLHETEEFTADVSHDANAASPFAVRDTSAVSPSEMERI